MTELERIETELDKTKDFQRRYNERSKGFSYILGKNLTLFVCMVIPFILVSFVWTDFGPVEIGPKLLSDGIVTVALFVVGEVMMTKLGADGGKLDTEYIKAKSDFDELVIKVGDVGSLLMGVFCDWQIDVEMKNAVNARLRILRMTPAMWNEVKDLSYEEWEQMYGKAKARKLLEIKTLKPIELNEAILLYDGDRTARGGVPISAEEYLKNRKHFINTLIACVFTGLLTVTVVVTLTQDITFARVLYTVFKLIMLLFRMAKGYDRGARAYNTIDVKQYRARSNYLRQYIAFIRDKIYLNLEDKYGDIAQFVGYTTTKE